MIIIIIRFFNLIYFLKTKQQLFEARTQKSSNFNANSLMLHVKKHTIKPTLLIKLNALIIYKNMQFLMNILIFRASSFYTHLEFQSKNGI